MAAVESIQLGESAPAFVLPAVNADGTQHDVTLEGFRGRWLILLFYPRDFSFVCPTELTAFADRYGEFERRQCEVLGISVDTLESHRRWLTSPTHAGGLGGLPFDLASDRELTVSRAYGVLDEQTRLSQRGLFLIDPHGTVQYAVIHAASVGRNVSETLRVLDALQSGGLCPASWTSADGTLDLENLLDVGRVLERFRLEEKLGEGSFGSVYAATDLRLARRVALKILRRVRPGSFEGLVNEARSASQIDDPHVCTVYSLEEIDGLSMIVMQLVHGEPLANRLREGLTPGESLRLARQIASGIQAAHRVGVVHGDLKPSNILINQEGQAVIVDFGLASVRRFQSRPLDPLDEETLLAESPAAPRSPDPVSEDGLEGDATQTIPHRRGIHGTPPYMSPEQARGEELTVASDIFSLGLLLVELLSGQRALPKLPVVQQLQFVQRPELAAELASRTSAEWQSLIVKMLAGDPAQRPTAGTVARELAAGHVE